jgi:hypothetical protein
MKNTKTDAKKTAKGAVKAEAKKAASEKKKGKPPVLYSWTLISPSFISRNLSPFFHILSLTFPIDQHPSKKDSKNLKDKANVAEEIKAPKVAEKKRKTPKDTSGPKRPQSAFFIFQAERRSLCKTENPELDNKGII